MLFILFMDDILSICQLETKRVVIESKFSRKQSYPAKELKYMEQDIDRKPDKIDTDKTKILVIAKNRHRTKITINVKRIKQAQKYNYLEVTIDEQGKI